MSFGWYTRSFPESSEWHNVWSTQNHPDDLATGSISSDDNGHCRMSSGWLTMLPYVIRMRLLIWSGWLSYSQCLIRMTYGRCIMSSGWHCWHWYLIRMSYGKFSMSSGWPTLPSYGNVIMSSRWDTFPFWRHPDETTNFDFPQHAVTLQRFRMMLLYFRKNGQCHDHWYTGSLRRQTPSSNGIDHIG